MGKLEENLAEIRAWVDQTRDYSSIDSNDDFMKVAVEMMNYCLYLLRLGASLVPNERVAENGYTKHRAIVVAHVIRTAKLFDGALALMADRKAELAGIFLRLALETVVRMLYIIRSKTKSKTIRSFIVTSYRPEREIIRDLDAKKRQRDLTPIEARISKKIRNRLRQDQISLKALQGRRSWGLDGKSFRAILKEVWPDQAYYFGFGSGSHLVHGDWYDMSQHHLLRAGGRYEPDLSYDDPDPRYACPLTAICLLGLIEYLKWARCDPDKEVISLAEDLLEVNREIDRAHERYLSTRG